MVSSPTPPTITLTEARAALEKIARDRAQLVATRVSLEQRLASARREIGERYFGDERGYLKEVGGLTAELEAVEQAFTTLDAGEKAAHVELQRASARDLRHQAQQKRVELAELNAATTKLLSELGKLEGVAYTHSILSAQPAEGAWVRMENLAPPLEYQGIPELQPNMPGPERKVEIPRSRRLRMEAEELEAKADALENRLS
jgi:hypothetical protein